MGLPPPNYKKDSLLAEPVQKKTVLPVQGGGFLQSQSGGAKPNENELLIQCHTKALQLHYIKGGKFAEPLGDDVKYSNGEDEDFEGIEKKSIRYSWVIGQECFDEAIIALLNTTGEYMKDGGTVIFVDYTTDMIDNLDNLKNFVADKEKIIPLTHKWDISIVKATDFPFLLGYNTGDEDRIPTHLMLFKLPGVPGEETESVTDEPQEPTIKLAVGFRVRNPEKVKDKIRELSFTQGEELLFKRLGFDKPFIRKYITLPDATKEESDASKDAFFKFWKMYVLMDGTSQFSLMTKGESQKVQQYMRDILDAYRKYLSESALQLLFHTSGKPYEPTLEGSSTDPFVFTKQGTPAKSQDHTKVSKAVKELIEAVAAAKEIDFKAHRISIAKTTTLTTAKASYEGLKIDIAKLIEQGKKAIAAGVVASLDTGETLTAITAVEGFTFTPGEDLEDVIKAANDLISLATNLIKKLEALEKAAREFAVIVEVEVEGEGEGEGDSNDESYEPSENGDEGSEDEEEEDDNSNADSNAGTVNTLETVRPRGPSNPIMIELKRLLLSIDKIVSKRVDDNKTISDIIVALSNALPEDDFGAKLRIFMGNPRKQEGIHIDVGSSKIAPTTFFNLYLIEKGKNVLEPNKRFTSIIHNLIKLDLRRLSEPVKAQLVQISKNKILLRDITKHRSRLLDFMDKRVT